MAKTWVVMCHRWKLHSGRPCAFLPHGVQSFYVRRANLVFTLLSKPFSGISVVGSLRVTPGACHFDEPSLRWEYPNVKKKAVAHGDATVRHLAALESGILHDLLPLVEHMAVTRYDDGDSRQTGWVTVKTQGAAWVIQVKDPDSGNSFTVVDASLDKALETASLMLACDEAPWSPDPFLKQQAAKKKK